MSTVLSASFLSLFQTYFCIEIEFGKPTGNFYFELIQLNQTGVREKKVVILFHLTRTRNLHCNMNTQF
jgi:hypothetical protein